MHDLSTAPRADSHHHDESARGARWLLAAAILFIVYASTLPFAFVSDATTIQEQWTQAIQRSAFSELSVLSKSDLLQNVLLFIPIGLLGVASFSRAHASVSLAATVVAAAVLSTLCELLQLFTANRLTSLWDVWANTSGALVGATVGLILRPVATRISESLPDAVDDRRRAYALLCAVAAVVVAACEPFDITLDVSTVWGKVKPLIADDPWTWRPLTDELLTSVRFAVLTYMLTDWIRRPGNKEWANRVVAVVVAGLLAVTLEATQFLISSRSPSMQDLCAGLSGALLGASVVSPMLRVVPGTRLLMAAIAIAAVPFYLQPFRMASDYGSLALMPFLAYYQFTSMQTVSHVVELMLIYAPIGFVLSWRRHGPTSLRIALVVTTIAAPLEYAQGWIVGRFPDVTDLAIAVLGGLAGAAIARAGDPTSGIAAPSSRSVQRKSPL